MQQSIHPSPIRVIQHRSDVGCWEMALRAPIRGLRAAVAGDYMGFSESITNFARRREPPHGNVVLIVNLGADFGIVDPRDTAGSLTYRSSFVAGLHDGYAITEATGPSCCLEVNFTPLGAYRLFGVAMHQLTNRVIALEDLLGSAADDLVDALHATPGWAERFDLLDRLILARMAKHAPASPGVAWAWRQLQQSGGNSTIGRLAAELGWSRKRLIGRFRNEIGLPPKALARVIRFNSVVAGIEGNPRCDWAEVAQACGYYDQAHLIRDFQEFAGDAPEAFLRRQLPDRGGYIGD
jgi:AraC-like DNA-binding protein